METKDKVDALIWDDCRITTSELCTTVGIGMQQLWPSSENLAKESLHKVSANNAQHGTKTARKENICTELLKCSQTGSDASLSRVITSEETWVHH
jgi:hypothetical protein